MPLRLTGRWRSWVYGFRGGGPDKDFFNWFFQVRFLACEFYSQPQGLANSLLLLYFPPMPRYFFPLCAKAQVVSKGRAGIVCDNVVGSRGRRSR